MRGLFWWRKDKKLAARIDNVVEITERARKAFRPKPPRVVIDTSFIDGTHQADEDVDAGADPVALDADYGPTAADQGDSVNGAGAAHEHGTEEAGNELSFNEVAEAAGVDGNETFELLQIALERFEDAERAEAEAKQAASEQRARADDLELKSLDAKQALSDAEAERDRAVNQAKELESELEDLRRQKADQPSRDGRVDEVTAERDELAGRIEQLEREVGEHCRSAEQQAEAHGSEVAARRKAEANSQELEAERDLSLIHI